MIAIPDDLSLYLKKSVYFSHCYYCLPIVRVVIGKYITYILYLISIPRIDELTGERKEDEGNLLQRVAGHKIRQ